ncbi:MAG: Methyltransferase type 11 [Candidatus Nomurabacteria bacterium GW2011_GWA1_46_11]|uniref:Methyltransferase type 11 n=1 Tax=Candidatus Nomurabacteria bacterium GW2011_GWA1_46_11 TaxID=1618732 RepID=A0A0G1QVX3_9BACT|nr:MAG: Methyltransferase type 11 [Microgenomates group bacterium GW2011_GWA2_44_7]KKT78035.1 MAG: Methyltransferase type 11 [Microgenomates group bacterium GW2011_GWB1_44_8]KKU21968.1 MAG: Methyltransferase type 11 [Candidatus Nomurabacteria bacterium GW2011_GWA1_46_11]
MRLSLLPLLYCPSCKRKLHLNLKTTHRRGPQIISGSLDCSARHQWPIVGGIPEFVNNLSNDKKKTSQRFGEQWLKLSTYTQDDQKQLLNWLYPVKPSFFGKKVVLDAGCGSGRHLLVTSAFKPKMLIGIDLSRAVEQAYAVTQHNPRIHIIQADIANLPFKRPFDFIYSVGVLHHLPNPKVGFQSLVGHLKPKGSISVWVYGKEGNEIIEKFVNPVRKLVTSRLPMKLLALISIPPAIIVFIIARLAPFLPDKLPLYKYFTSLQKYSLKKIFLIVYDHLNAPTAFYLSQDQVRDFVKGAKIAQTIISHRLGNGWNLLMQKPS